MTVPVAEPPPHETGSSDGHYHLDVPIDGSPNCRATAFVYYGKRTQNGAAASKTEPGEIPRVYKPLIIVEGFTPRPDGIRELYEKANQNSMVDHMRGLGYDVVLLDLEDAQRAIQENARVVIQCIETSMGSARSPLVVAGISMGGLVARFALAQMEAHNQQHLTRIYLSIDTPHRGAYTSLAIQWFARHLGPTIPALAGMVGLLDSVANQQFLVHWLTERVAVQSPERDRFLAELQTLGGYPSRPRLLAIASGRGDGRREVYAPQLGLTLRKGSIGNLDLWCAPAPCDGKAVVAAATSANGDLEQLEVASQHVWDDVPGGTNQYFANAAAIACSHPVRQVIGEVKLHHGTSCAVPTISALDLDQSLYAPVPPPEAKRSPFHDYIWSERNEAHATITEKASQWVVRHLFDPHARDFLDDPYPTYRVLRDCSPVFIVEPYNSYWVFRYDDVRRILEDRDSFQKNPDAISPPPFDVLRHLPESPLSSDPPRHTLLRKFIDPLFGQEIERAEKWTEQIATELLDPVRDLGRLELIADFALPLPSRIIQRLLGVPAEAWPLVEQWVSRIAEGHDITQPPEIQVMGGTCHFALSAYYQAFLLGCQAKPENPGLLEAMSLHAGREGFRQEDVQVLASVLTIAGYLSTTFLLGAGVLRLLHEPQQLGRLRRLLDRERASGALANAVQEMLRYDTPAQLVDRIAAVDVVLSGVSIRAGEKVTAVLGSANRDERFLADADSFDIDRSYATDRRPLAFGDGIHRCLGEPLVEKVMPAALGVLLRTFPALAVAGEPQWQTDPYLRGLTSLPLATYDDGAPVAP